MRYSVKYIKESYEINYRRRDMSAYTFGAEPKVVKNKAKYRAGGDDAATKTRTPLEMAEEAIKNEKDQRKIELLKEQLIQFKKNKTKQTPYELRPLPPPKIEVDLNYFLTEQNVLPPVIGAQDTQTDEMLPGPPEEQYLPQKKGIDQTTQIWDDDLFDYDREVEPILHVLVSKTLEQARLEVDEASEIDAIRKYKAEYKDRRQVEREDWEAQVKEELKRVAKKNEMLKREREKREKQEIAVKKLQCVHIAKSYLSRTLHNALGDLISVNHWQNEQIEAIHGTFIPAVVAKATGVTMKKEEIRTAMHSLTAQMLIEPMKMIDPIRAQLKEKQQLREKPRKIQDPRFRNIRVRFYNLARPKIPRFGLLLRKSLTGKLEEWEKELKEEIEKIHSIIPFNNF